MKRYTEQTRTITERRVTDVICNLCGESCLDAGNCHNQLGLEARIVGCFGSTFPQDLERWDFDLCEPCAAALVARFKHPPTATPLSMMGDELDDPSHPGTRILLAEGRRPADVPDRVMAVYAKVAARLGRDPSPPADPAAPSWRSYGLEDEGDDGHAASTADPPGHDGDPVSRPCESCQQPATHAEHWYQGVRAWCEAHTPWSGHYEAHMIAAAGEVSECDRLMGRAPPAQPPTPQGAGRGRGR